MNQYPIFTCDCGRVFYVKMDYKLHVNPYAYKVECPNVKKEKAIFVSKYPPQPIYLYCDPEQNFKVVASSNEKNSYKDEDKWRKNVAK